MTHTVSLGMFVAGACFLAYRLSRWFVTNKKGARSWKSLLPLAWGIVLAMCASACTSGIIGWLSMMITFLQGQVGNIALTAGTGAHNVNAHTSHAFGALTQWGAALLLIAIAGVAGAWKHVTSTVKVEMSGGGWAGLALGPLIGGYALIPAINSLGLSTIGKLFHAA